ncbi:MULTISPECIES: aminotransferase-like domain-containing protein [unclassified Psychrobacter]|uniref:aminotransferase-like domain-containing protein n=1 Tax=unclassified Psychrobacter TaxID=196806 RepID=UPI003F480DC8
MKKFEKICLLVIDDIKSGRKKVGDKIPSIRAMAEKHKVSKNTIVNAYNILLEQHWIKALPKSGFYVGEDLSSTPMLNSTPFYTGIDLLEQQMIDQSHHKPGAGRYPKEYMDKLNLELYLGQASDNAELADFDRGNGDPAGNVLLRGLIVDILSKRALTVDSQNVLLTYGTNHSLDLIIRQFLTKGDQVIVESPGYYPLFSKLDLHQVHINPIKRTKFGLDVNNLESIIQKQHPKILFLQPFAHNPTGTDLNVPNMAAIQKLCIKYNVLIVENDPFLLARDGTASYFFNKDCPVIYVSSFSKTISASIRCGFIVASKSMIKSLTRLKMITVINTSSIMENILNHLITSGALANHLHALKMISDEKSVAAITALSKIDGLTLYPHNPSGNFLWFRIPMDDKKVVNDAKSNNIFIAPGNLFFPSDPAYFALRVNKFYIDKTTVNFIKTTVFNNH